tara:strand:+ start:448 stop:1599 length:1152 start_codon:yes stop_codon:yes gene_type:complete
MKVIIPILGKGSRFVSENYPMPKQLLPLADQLCLTYSLSNINCKSEDMIFLLREDSCKKYQLDSVVKKHYPKAKIYIHDKETKGTLESVLLAEPYLEQEESIFIHTLDIHSEPEVDCYIDPLEGEPGGVVYTIRANSSGYSYVAYDSLNRILKTAEKKVISDQAAVGIYYFSSFNILKRNALRMIAEGNTTKGEYFVAPVYNYLIADGLTIKKVEMDSFTAFGTPVEYEFTKTRLQPRSQVIGLTSDHSGRVLLRGFSDYLTDCGIPYLDFSHSKKTDSLDYPDQIELIVNAYRENKVDKCFTFCRSGQGVNIAANKHQGIRSALIYSEYAAEYAIKHTDAYFFAIPTVCTSLDLLIRYFKIISSCKFQGGRHQLRLQKLGSN